MAQICQDKHENLSHVKTYRIVIDVTWYKLCQQIYAILIIYKDMMQQMHEFESSYSNIQKEDLGIEWSRYCI